MYIYIFTHFTQVYISQKFLNKTNNQACLKKVNSVKHLGEEGVLSYCHYGSQPGRPEKGASPHLIILFVS